MRCHHFFTRLAVLAGLICLLVFPSLAVAIEEPSQDKIVDGRKQALLVQKGRKLAETQCSGCHAIGKTGDSPRKECPPFRTLHKKWPVETLEESLAEGIMTGHNDMPETKMSVEEMIAFIAFLKSLEG